MILASTVKTTVYVHNHTKQYMLYLVLKVSYKKCYSFSLCKLIFYVKEN